MSTAKARTRRDRAAALEEDTLLPDTATTEEPKPARKIRLPDGTRSTASPFVWRGLLLMALVALGLSLTLVAGGHATYAALWGVIAAGWFAVSMWLWRRHVNYMR